MWYETVQTKNGTRFKYSERFKGDDGKEVKTSKTFAKKATKRTEREYYDLLYKQFLKRQKKQEKLNPASNIKTFYDLLDVWYKLKVRNVKYNSQRALYSLVRRIKRFCEDVPLSALSANMVRQLLEKSYYEKQYAYNSVLTMRSFILNALQYAHREHLMPDVSSFLQIRVEQDRKRETEKRIKTDRNKFLNHDELSDVLKQLRGINENVALAMEFIALTGLRIGELLALRPIDYDRTNHLIHVNGTIIYGKKNGEDGQRGTPKTLYSVRDVLLNARAEYILDTMIAKYRSSLWKQGKKADTRPREVQYIFCSRTGHAWSYSTIKRHLQRVSIPDKHITTHIFRHTHISILAEQGVPLKAIMQRVGHHNPQTTLNIYMHVTNAMKEKERQIIEKIDV